MGGVRFEVVEEFSKYRKFLVSKKGKTNKMMKF